MAWAKQGTLRAPNRFLGGGPTVKTASFTAAANTAYLVDLTSATADILITLPSSPSDGDEVLIARADSTVGSGFLVEVTPPASSSWAGLGGQYVVGPYMVGQFTYLAAGNVWVASAWGTTGMTLYPNSPKSAWSAGQDAGLMARDGNGRAQVADPSSAQDIATKNYADGRMRYAGTYSATTAYALNDVVQYATDGAFYICIQAGTNHTPSASSTFWKQLQPGVQYYEEANLNNITIAASYQNIGCGATTRFGSYPTAVTTATALFTAPVTGIYSFFASGFTGAVTTTTLARVLLQFATASSSSSPLFRQEIDTTVNISSAALNVGGMRRLTAGTTVYCQLWASGSFVGVSFTGEQISWFLHQAI